MPRPRRALRGARAAWCLVGLLAAAAACTRGARPQAPLRPCVLPGVPREARCVDVDVPLDWEAPAAGTLRVHAAVLPAEGSRALPDPLFVFAGGPGQAAGHVAELTLGLFGGLTARRDVVFVDQRGTGQSHPLDCPDAGQRLPAHEHYDMDAGRRRLTACRDALVARGEDLRQYATWLAVRDVDRVREVLGYEQLNAWGASYGTRAALEYARQFPGRVRALVLDGVAPADVVLPVAMAEDTDAALDAWVAACRADPACGGAPLDDALKRLLDPDAGVTTTTTRDAFFGQPAMLTLGHAQRLGLVRGPLYVPTLGAIWPYAVRAAADGDFTPLVGLEAALSGLALSQGMHFSVLCAEDVPRLTPSLRAQAARTRAGTAFLDEYDDACRGWPTRPVPPAYFEPSTVAAPTLLLSGALDPATPPRHAQALAQRLPHATHVVARALAHGVSGRGCGPQLVQRFVRDLSLGELDAGCLDDLPFPTAFRPPEPP